MDGNGINVTTAHRGLVLDTLARRSLDGTAFVGGSPFRVLKLSAAGTALVDRWLEIGAGMPAIGVGNDQPTTKAVELWRRVVDAGIAHPVPLPATDLGTIAAIVPVLNDVEGLGELLVSLRAALTADEPIIVIDDGSDAPQDIADLAAEFGAEVIGHDRNLGPAAARNTGWSAVRSRWPDTTAVLFIDADVVIERDALAQLVGHFDLDDSLGVVAPRVMAQSGRGAIHAYESAHSPLDMGPHPAQVSACTRVSYVPSATMLVRAEVLVDIDGFDPELRVGEDVDFVWRAADAGWSVRYVSEARVHHRSRRDIGAMARQRFAYGTSAALLESRHPDHVFPVELSLSHLAIWSLALVGRGPGKLLAGVAVAAFTRNLTRKLEPSINDAPQIAAKVVADSHRFGLSWLGNAATRAWAPLLLWNWLTRRGLGVALLVPAVLDWWPLRKSLNPARFLFLRVIDHGAYCAGLWTGAKRSGSLRAVLPRFRRH